MSISKSELLKTLGLFKVRQDAANDAEFVAKEDGKGLSTNDYSNDDKTKLEGVATGAQVNVIESISIDGTAQTITDKAVALDLTAYAKKSDVASALSYKGTVPSFSELPITDLNTGDVYNITAAGGTDANGTAIKAGDNVAYNGTGWDVLAGTTDLSSYFTKTEIAQQFTDREETVTDEDVASIFTTGA